MWAKPKVQAAECPSTQRNYVLLVSPASSGFSKYLSPCKSGPRLWADLVHGATIEDSRWLNLQTRTNFVQCLLECSKILVLLGMPPPMSGKHLLCRALCAQSSRASV